ncbi:SRPBCC domain-containing protein [Phyllobacterium sp. A18/5-2]|nr:SRPBCC domain-containing protein [Phyllobacterium sp. A18/5-2]UXN65444.1 SRPBCC domain-containing protein [Phyllobacterium sp. A18/5-2]
MTKRSVVHDTFVIERSYPAAPARVFFALSDKQAKEKWFVGPPEWGTNHHEMDFRVGGRETNSVLRRPKAQATGLTRSIKTLSRTNVSSTATTCILATSGSPFRWQRSS